MELFSVYSIISLKTSRTNTRLPVYAWLYVPEPNKLRILQKNNIVPHYLSNDTENGLSPYLLFQYLMYAHYCNLETIAWYFGYFGRSKFHPTASKLRVHMYMTDFHRKYFTLYLHTKSINFSVPDPRTVHTGILELGLPAINLIVLCSCS